METRRLVPISMLIAVVMGTEYNCPSTQQCTCTSRGKKVYVDCSNRGLQTSPTFPDDVIAINFARNKFSEMPQNLPRTLMYLDMSHNNLQHLNQSSLSRYGQLKHFSVSQNKLSEVHIGTFKRNSKIEHLDVSKNDVLTIDVIYNISIDLKNSKIETLNFEKLHCTYGVSHIVTVDHVVNLKQTNLLELNLASNRINSLELGVLTSLPRSLRILNLSDNVLSFGLYIMEFAVLHNLEILNISYQSSFHQVGMDGDFFKKCNDARKPPIFRLDAHVSGTKHNNQTIPLSELSLGKDNVGGWIKNYTIYLPENLRYLYYHDNLYKMSLPKFPLGKKNKLTHIFGQRNILYELIGPITGVDHVQYIDLSGNFCRYIEKSFLKSFKTLRNLNLSNNALGQVFEKDTNGELFSEQYQLTSLDLSSNRIVRLPAKIFQNNYNIIYMNLSYNSMTEFHVQINHMKNLSLVDLSYNQLSSLKSSTRDALDTVSRGRVVNVNLIGNNLKCSCENLDFLKWMQDSETLKFVFFGNYTCAFGNSSNFPMSDIDILLQSLEKKCSSYTLVIVVMTSLIIISTTLLLSRIIYRYRWKLRYMYYVAREKYQGRVNIDDANCPGSYRYHAFISYADLDRTFVIRLAKILEKEYNLRLCIHHRDFIPGTGIAENITNAIHNSRQTVCIMTSHFLTSYWCMFELNMARMEAIYSRNGENVLFLIALQSRVMRDLPLHLMDLVESKSYLEYPEGETEEETAAFRAKLGETLKCGDDV
ncbi:toll-like receptor 4 [Ostrea edulis]|uniref:toll-like receptor 4 n=1 Tax=Ostrea edulis TaxID=37623 RepID=UPI0024AE97EE|nr:toll-like receptor 4 [Ostrea edulis]